MHSFIASPNKSNRDHDIDAIVIHFTASGSLDGTVAWFKNSASKVSSHYVIGVDGSVVQMVRDEDVAWHAGKSILGNRTGVNKFSIGIELVNWGELKFKDGKFYAWPNDYNREYNAMELGEPVLKDDIYWAPYPEKQISACIKLCEALRMEYPAITEDRIVGHMHISYPRKTDPGPHFPFDKLRIESRPKS